MAYDPVHGRTLLAGGSGTAGTSFETWAWGGKFWTQIGRFGPSGRSGTTLSYDEARQRTILFGGSSTADGNETSDTWSFDGVDWTQVEDIGPTPRRVHATAYDSARSRIVLFGGLSKQDPEHPRQALGDTWEWDGESWTQVEDAGPLPRGAHCMAYDSARQRVVLFGGIGTDVADVFDDTWEWDGTNWTKVADTGPSPRAGAAMTSTGATLILHGGSGPDGVAVGDTWQWAAGDWTKLQEMGPSARIEHAMAFDHHRNRVVLFGGLALPALADTWEAPIAAPDDQVTLDVEPSDAQAAETAVLTATLAETRPVTTVVLITVATPGNEPRPVGTIAIPAGTTSATTEISVSAVLAALGVEAPTDLTFTTDRGGSATLRVLP
ncbi:hypothetical protein BVU76_22750 [Mycolicibacterium porcinum]|nr:hypothetical protein BVU76_22750 [Mycolicibacterium porcinum]